MEYVRISPTRARFFCALNSQQSTFACYSDGRIRNNLVMNMESILVDNGNWEYAPRVLGKMPIKRKNHPFQHSLMPTARAYSLCKFGEVKYTFGGGGTLIEISFTLF